MTGIVRTFYITHSHCGCGQGLGQCVMFKNGSLDVKSKCCCLFLFVLQP